MEPFDRLQDILPDHHYYLEQLKSNLVSMIHTIVSAHRGHSASDLVFRTISSIEQEHYKFRICYLDMLHVHSEADFETMIADGLGQGISAGPRTYSHIQSGNDEPARDKAQRLATKTIENFLWFPEFLAIQQNKKLIIVVSNFHYLTLFDRSLSLFGKINATWDKHRHCVYCLIGNKSHLQRGLFNHPQRPARLFFKRIEIQINTGIKIPRLVTHFENSGKPISEKVARVIVRYAGGHPYYINLIAQITYFLAKNACTISTVERAHSLLLNQFSVYFAHKADSLSSHQLNFLRAYFENEFSLCSARILDQYNLGSSANVSRVKESLCKKEIIDVIRGQVYLLDPLFVHWLERNYFR